MSDELKHTPGPWEIHTDDLEPFEGPLITGAGRMPWIASIMPWVDAPDEWQANARLIARAPMLIAELATLRTQNAALVEACGAALAEMQADKRTSQTKVIRQLENVLAAAKG